MQHPATGPATLTGYIGAIAAANWLTARYGMVPVGLRYALDLAAGRMASRDGFTDEDEAALVRLRRMADEAQQPTDGEAEAAPYPPEVQWIAQELEGGDEWMQLASGADRGYVEGRLTSYRTRSPHGLTTRLIRVTTTYTVEQPAPAVTEEAPPKARPAVAYSDGMGNARIYCIACPRPDDVIYPLDIEAVDDWDLCPSCGRHCRDVARDTPTPAGTEEAK